MNNLWTWDEMIKSIEEFEKTLDVSYYLTDEDWRQFVIKIGLH